MPNPATHRCHCSHCSCSCQNDAIMSLALLFELLQRCLHRLQLRLLARNLPLLVPQLPGHPPLLVNSQRSLLSKLMCQAAQDGGVAATLCAVLQQLQPHSRAGATTLRRAHTRDRDHA